jgi:predicted transcriptional regulator
MQQEIIMLITYMAEISTKLGKNLKRIRTAKKLSQGAISRKLEVHQSLY